VETGTSGRGPVRDPSWAQQLHTLYFDSGVPVRRRRPMLGVMVVLGAVVAAGGVYSVAAGSATSLRQRDTAGPAAKPAHGVAPTAPTTTLAPPLSEPGGGRTLLPNRRIVAFYGAAGVPKLGVLGEAPPDQLWPRLEAQAVAYQQPGTRVLAAYELIAFATQSAPGPDHDYAQRTSDATIEHYLNVVRVHQGLLILDIQPGRGDFLDDAKTLSHWLEQPDVALALDPEWKLDINQLPSRQIGHTTAAALNAVSTWLSQLVASSNLPQKLLLIHQFTNDMVRDKPSVQSAPGLALVFNMDGFGGQEAKLSKYELLTADSRFLLGLKVFYHQDTNPFTPADLLTLTPAPNVVEYQ
jgi:hypothetical protein